MTKNLCIKIDTLKFNLLAPSKMRRLFRQSTITMDELMLLFNCMDNLNCTYLAFGLFTKYDDLVPILLNETDALMQIPEDMITQLDSKMEDLLCIISD